MIVMSILIGDFLMLLISAMPVFFCFLPGCLFSPPQAPSSSSSNASVPDGESYIESEEKKIMPEENTPESPLIPPADRSRTTNGSAKDWEMRWV